MIEEGFVASHLDRYCEERGFLGWFETSAKDNINIDESANLLIKEVNFSIVLLSYIDALYDSLVLNDIQLIL